MSRTFRRKDYESCNPEQDGSKVAGYYTERDTHCVEHLRGYSFYYTYREPTDREYYKAYWCIHADTHRNAFSPSRSYRHSRDIENTTINKRELQKYLSKGDYEPMFEESPRSCRWDWS